MHVVTGRKPRDPRPGDMLRDGTRQGMAASKLLDPKKIDTSKSHQWTRAVLDAKLLTMMKSQVINNLSTLQESHVKLSHPSLREKSDRASE